MFFWTTWAVYAVILVSTATVIVMENRQSAKTIAWLIVITLLPFVGLVAFYFFGQSMKKERFISRHSYERLTHRMLLTAMSHLPETMPEKYAPLIRQVERMNLSPAFSGNAVRVLAEGNEFFLSLLQAIGQAQHHIHLESYIFEDDALGRLVRDMLIDKQREGVEVRLLYDDVGCWRVPERFFKSFKAAGIEIRAFLPVRFPSLTHKVNYRNHRKICSIDGRIGFIGGMNIALRYASRPRRWVDMQLRIEGGAVASLQRLFLADWEFVTGAPDAFPDFFQPAGAPESGDALVQIVDANPVSAYPEIMYGITWAAYHAQRYLYIQTPYFMPTEPVLQALQTAAQGGVDVRLMVPSKPDGILLRWANDSYFSDVLGAGIRVFTYEGGFLHGKTMVIDDEWCSVGSSNFDFRSFDNNFEANAFVYDGTISREVRSVFEEHLRHCVEIERSAWEERPRLKRWAESMTRIASPLL